MRLSRRQLLAAAAAGSLPTAARAATPLRVGMSLADIPHLWGAPEGGFEGLRFAGYPLYDALVGWDLGQGEKPSRLVPGLATSWQRDPADTKRWIVTLRDGVTFHDGSAFDADAAVWNIRSQVDETAPQYYAPRAGLNRARMPSLAGAEKLDERRIAVLTNVADATTPYQLTFLLMASPTQFARLGSWDKFNLAPSGTGAFKFDQMVPRVRLSLLRNEAYWDKARVPKAAAMQFLVMPDPNTKVAALRSGEVDLIESVTPDAIESLRAAGLTVQENIYPHIWNWTFSQLPDSPFRDIRVRKAANLAIDREGMVALLNGTAVAATSYTIPGSPWKGQPSFKLTYAPEAAKAELKAAGYGDKPLRATILIANSGGGQMQPLTMNDFIRGNLAAVGIEVDFKIVDFITLFTDYRIGAAAPANAGLLAINLASPTQDPTTMLRGFDSHLVAPRGTNWGHYANPVVDAILGEAQGAADEAALDRAMAKLDTTLTDDAVSLLVVHDKNVRAAGKRVSGLVSPRNWFFDFGLLSVEG